MQAFRDCSTMRPPAFGGPTLIPWDKVELYGLSLGLNASDRQSLWDVIHSIDRKYVGYLAEKLESIRRTPKKPQPDPGRGTPGGLPVRKPNRDVRK